MVEISGKYKIGTRRFGSVNWIGAWTLYKKEVLRFLIVWIQTLFSPLITSLLFLSVLSLAIGNDRGDVLGVPFIVFLAQIEVWTGWILPWPIRCTYLHLTIDLIKFFDYSYA